MSNFIGLVYATLKNEGIDTSGMSTDEAVAKFKELQKSSGGNEGEKEGTPAEQKKVAEMTQPKKQETIDKSWEQSDAYDTSKTNKDILEEARQEEIANNSSLKDKQLAIINKYNPMRDDYHTGIRKVEDIKTFEETLDDDESFVWGDFSKEDAEKAIKKGKVIVYSSKPIEQGVFVSTSKNQAKDYAGNNQIYSKEVDLDKVAWINGDEGQFADITKDNNISNNSSKKTYKIPDYIKDMHKRNFKTYDIKEIDIEDAIEQNGLLKNNSVLNRRYQVWGESYDDYKINLNKLDYEYSNPIRFTLRKDGQLGLEDGAHRLIALKNAGYNKVEALVRMDK